MTQPSDALQLHRSPLNRLAKSLAKPLSRLALSPVLLRTTRYASAYLNVLLGNGSGTGWDLAGEVDAAISVLPQPEPVVFDVGANRGEWTQLLLKHRPAARVVLFEPAPGCHPHLQPLLGDRVQLVTSAVGAAEGVIQLWSSSETDGAASVHRRSDSFLTEMKFAATEVSVTTLDAYAREQNIERIDFVKLDIEGHELAALHGARTCLQEKKIRALAFEFGSANVNSRTFFRDFWDLLVPLGYDLARITPAGRLLPVQSYYEDLEYFRGVSNYLATLRAR